MYRIRFTADVTVGDGTDGLPNRTSSSATATAVMVDDDGDGDVAIVVIVVTMV